MKGRSLNVRVVFSAAACLAACAAALGGCSYLASRKASYGPTVKDEAVVFRFYAPSARRVQLAGDWPENNWAKGDGRVGEANIGLMEDDDANGVWEIAVDLPPGRYKYLFWMDETSWHVDPGNPEEVPGGPTGTCSQIILFPKNGRQEIR